MFHKLALLASLLYLALFAQAWTKGPIKIKRNFSGDFTPNVKDFGCVVLGKWDDGAYHAAVSGDASRDECAQFNIEGDESGWRFVERSTNKSMSHTSGSHWIYFDRPAGDTTDDTRFLIEEYRFTNTQQVAYTLRPANSRKVIYAQYNSGDMNVKGSGFRMYVDEL